MMQSPLAVLPPLPPAATSRLIAASPGPFAASSGLALPVPPSAFAEAQGVPQSQVIKDWKKAGGFAAMAIGELLQPMFDTVHLSDTRFGGGAGEQAWKPVLVEAIGEGIAREGGLGLTETVFRELLREQAASVSQPTASASSATSDVSQGSLP